MSMKRSLFDAYNHLSNNTYCIKFPTGKPSLEYCSSMSPSRNFSKNSSSPCTMKASTMRTLLRCAQGWSCTLPFVMSPLCTGILSPLLTSSLSIPSRPHYHTITMLPRPPWTTSQHTCIAWSSWSIPTHIIRDPSHSSIAWWCSRMCGYGWQVWRRWGLWWDGMARSIGV